jgi:ergothioneine biosynthesis protein EgtB
VTAPVLAAPDLLARYREVRAGTERLLEGLSPEDCQVQSMPDASPTRWHLAHTTWFFETFVLAKAESRHRPFHETYAHLFNSYYETLGAPFPRPQRGLLTRPSLDEVLAYRRDVDERVERVAPSAGADVAAVLELGLHHEQQHQELICTDLKHLLSLHPLRPAYRPGAPRPAAGPATRLAWTSHSAGVRAIGHEGEGFAFDNEGPRHRVFVEGFEIASRPVTNGEYLAFVEDGGYRAARLWISDGWKAVQAERWTAPAYWERAEGAWAEFTLRGVEPLDLAAPVAHVSFYEADAYARWAHARLPTEAEWEVAVAGLPVRGRFLEDGAFHPAAAPPGDGLRQAYGDVWEWTSSAYAAYPGYRAAESALGEYNGKFMVGQQVLRGGSCVTPRGHARPTYRNFFPPPARWQFSGIRLAR